MGGTEIAHGWCYEALKDFAPAFLTAVAAGVALWINCRFQRKNIAISTQQAETAYNKLNMDLFNKRYEIYSAARDIINICLNEAHSENFCPQYLLPKILIVDEAPFFFPKDACEEFSNIVKISEKISGKVAERKLFYQDNNAAWAATADEIHVLHTRLADIHKNMVTRFSPYLSVVLPGVRTGTEH